MTGSAQSDSRKVRDIVIWCLNNFTEDDFDDIFSYSESERTQCEGNKDYEAI